MREGHHVTLRHCIRMATKISKQNRMCRYSRQVRDYQKLNSVTHSPFLENDVPSSTNPTWVSALPEGKNSKKHNIWTTEPPNQSNANTNKNKTSCPTVLKSQSTVQKVNCWAGRKEKKKQNCAKCTSSTQKYTFAGARVKSFAFHQVHVIPMKSFAFQ